ncbi:MAG: hypothetical protein GY749_29325 [Desulfobacteraceae bacterium]|nr:hypothetical protein [Desulfobacteraceae bacterium]
MVTAEELKKAIDQVVDKKYENVINPISDKDKGNKIDLEQQLDKLNNDNGKITQSENELKKENTRLKDT